MSTPSTSELTELTAETLAAATKKRRKVWNNARARSLKQQHSRLTITREFGEVESLADADAAAARALRNYDHTLLLQQRRASLSRKAELHREAIAASARSRARQRGASEAAAEAAGNKALEECDAANKGRRARLRHDAYILLRTPDARPKIEAQEVWRDKLLPVSERVLAALLVRHRDIGLSELRRRANVVGAQLELQPGLLTRRLELFVRGTIADILAPLPEAPAHKLKPRASLLRRTLSRLWPKAASATK